MFRLTRSAYHLRILRNKRQFLIFQSGPCKLMLLKRCFQVSIIGGSNPTSQTLCLLLKEHPLVTRLSLFDFRRSTFGSSVDLSHIPSKPQIQDQDQMCPPERGLAGTHIAVLASSEPKRLGQTDYDLFKMNADYIILSAQEISKHCPEAFIVNLTEPINYTTPFTCRVLQANTAYNKNKVFGVTGRDALRAQSCLHTLYNLPKKRPINVPVICGISSKTTVPLLSHITPWFNVDNFAAVMITEHVRGTENHIISMKGGAGHSSLSNAFAGFCTVAFILKALKGRTVKHIAFVPNDDFNTKYFASPVTITEKGITATTDYKIFSSLEAAYLQDAIKQLSIEVNDAETYYKEISESQNLNFNKML